LLVRSAIAAWCLVVTVICVRVALQPEKRNLYPTWAAAGRDWIEGRLLYRSSWEPGLDQVRYSPTVAMSFAPLTRLPEVPGNVLWRLLNAGVLLGGLYGWARASLPSDTNWRDQGILALLVLPLALGSLNNGQPNSLLVGFLLLGFAAGHCGRWNIAALCLAAS